MFWKTLILCFILVRCEAFRPALIRQRYLFESRVATQKSEDVIKELIVKEDYENIFKLLRRNPLLVPSKEQTILLLNNLNVLAKISNGSDVSKFYNRLKKGTGIPSYGSMGVDGPLTGMGLPKFENLMKNDPSYLQQSSGLSEDSFESLSIPNELGVMSSACRSSLEIRVKLQVELPLLLTLLITIIIPLKGIT
jgi:hypothetical protein